MRSVSPIYASECEKGNSTLSYGGLHPTDKAHIMWGFIDSLYHDEFEEYAKRVILEWKNQELYCR